MTAFGRAIRIKDKCDMSKPTGLYQDRKLMNSPYLYQLVLIEEIPEWEAKGWELASKNVASRLGNYISVYMRRAA